MFCSLRSTMSSSRNTTFTGRGPTAADAVALKSATATSTGLRQSSTSCAPIDTLPYPEKPKINGRVPA